MAMLAESKQYPHMTDTSPFFTTIIIPTYHDWGRLRLCLNALARQTYPDDHFEVLVVNNDPQDVPPYEPESENVRVITEGKPGSYAARNAGIKVAKGEILAFTDSDCIPREDWIENAVNALRRGKERIAGHVELLYKESKLTWAEIYEREFAFTQKNNAEKGVAATANMITWKSLFYKVGLFNDDLLSGGDVEWARRAMNYNVDIEYENDVVVKHPTRSSIRKLLKKRKRTSGSMLNYRNRSRLKSTLGLLYQGYQPNMKLFFDLSKRSDLCIKEKAVVYMVKCLLNFYSTNIKILLLLSLTNPSRE